MPGRFDFVGACPECGGAVTIETRSGTHTGTLRVTPFAEIRSDHPSALANSDWSSNFRRNA